LAATSRFSWEAGAVIQGEALALGQIAAKADGCAFNFKGDVYGGLTFAGHQQHGQTGTKLDNFRRALSRRIVHTHGRSVRDAV
jgi:hypothetical protein